MVLCIGSIVCTRVQNDFFFFFDTLKQITLIRLTLMFITLIKVKPISKTLSLGSRD